MIVATAPRETVEQLANLFREADWTDWDYAGSRVLGSVTAPEIRCLLDVLLRTWRTEFPQEEGAAIALALQTACVAEESHRHRRVELVWTGPDSRLIPVRRTDQALLQVINSSIRRLMIVSFAVYRIDAIVSALVEAARRRVRISICVESPDLSEGKIAYDTMRPFGTEVREYAHFYIWPLDKRPRSPNGKYGSLHSKVAVADGNMMLLSSANLTEYAMSLNMELGVLVQGGEIPGQVERHFEQMIADGVMEPV